MAGMRALGREYDVVPGIGNAPTITVALKDCSGVGFVVTALQTATATLTVYGATKYTGGTSTAWTPANGFGQPGTFYYRSAATAHWTASTTTASWSSNALTVAATSGYVSYVDFLVSELADTYDYISVTGGASTQVQAILYDLTVQRTPANLRIPSA
jgi:hypothetical protein